LSSLKKHENFNFNYLQNFFRQKITDVVGQVKEKLTKDSTEQGIIKTVFKETS